jgi:signal peptidase
MRVISNIFYGICIVLLIAVATLFLASLVPLGGGIEVKIVRSGSMEPSISTGSLVVIRPSASYEVGDVITFGEDTGTAIPTTHRIVERRGTSYVTKGDANEEVDPREIAHSAVIGKVLIDVPFAGYILDFARQPLGFVLLIGLPALIIIFDELAAIWIEIRKLRKGKHPPKEPTKTVYVRRRATDDILVPMRTPREKVSSPRPTAALWTGLFVVPIIAAAFFGNIGTTVSYLSDREQSVDNVFISGALNLDIAFAHSPNALLGLVATEREDHSSAYALLTLSPGAGSVPLKYHLFVEEPKGDLCRALDLRTRFEGEVVYEGALEKFSGTTTTQFGTWELELVVPGSAHGSCSADVVFSAWRADTHLSVDSGYTDEERVTLTLSTKEPLILPQETATPEFIGTTIEEVESVEVDATTTPQVASTTPSLSEEENASTTEPVTKENTASTTEPVREEESAPSTEAVSEEEDPVLEEKEPEPVEEEVNEVEEVVEEAQESSE